MSRLNNSTFDPLPFSRPHGSSAASGEWSVGPHEPYWRTNSSYSPPHSRWDFRFQYEALPYALPGVDQLYGSSESSNSKECRDWVRSNHLLCHGYSMSDACPDLSQGPQWTPPAIQEINFQHDDAPQRDPTMRSLSSASAFEGTSKNYDSSVSTSSCSDSSDSELMLKSCLPPHRNISSRRLFISKPVHPLFFPTERPTGEASDFAPSGLHESDTGMQMDGHSWSSATSSNDFADVCEAFESEAIEQSYNLNNGFRCGLCGRLLSRRSPWGSCRIVRSGDMPVAGVLSCRHVFHAECLDQTTPKTHKNDPPCPLCVRGNDENSIDRLSSKFRNGLPRFRPLNEAGPSRPWGCGQVGDRVDGALRVPPGNAMMLLSRNRVKKKLSLKGNLSKEYPGKLRKASLYCSHPWNRRSDNQIPVGSSSTIAGPSVRKS